MNEIQMWKNTKVVESTDANVKKLVFTNDDAVAEAVLYKYPTYEDRTVICCSTQSGCPVGCRFCGAGDHFVRSLTTGEIVAQVDYAIGLTGVNPAKMQKLQVMFMSMGEPMLNYRALRSAIILLYVKYPNAALLVSTSAPQGCRENILDLGALSSEIETIGLQFSVHESTDEARKKLIPSPTSTLAEIAGMGSAWAHAASRQPFFNYCVHERNNSADDIFRLLKLFDVNMWQATLSVICERDEHVAAANERQRELTQDFASRLLTAGYSVRVFNPAGQDDIGGGCGQLWYVQDWMKKHPDKAKPTKGAGLPVVHTPK